MHGGDDLETRAGPSWAGPQGPDWQVGEFIDDRWQVLGLRRGGMGVVYIVRDQETNETLAAKTYRDDVCAGDSELADRFEREALAWVQIGAHHHIVQARHVRRIRRKPLLFLEYAPGGTLAELIPTLALAGLPPEGREYLRRAEAIFRLAAQFCDGMAHAARSGVLAHRDIKPENCLLGPSPGDKPGWAGVNEGGWALKITDFGLAKVFEGAPGPTTAATTQLPAGADLAETVRAPLRGLGLVMTRTGAAAGTVTHMAPEQFEDLKRVDARADVYSFGVMLYQMVTGQLPFRGRSPLEYMRLHQQAKAPDLATPFHDLNALVARCLAKEPADRFEDFTRVRAALEQAAFEKADEFDPDAIQHAIRHVKRRLKKARSDAEASQTRVALRALRMHLARGPAVPSKDWIRWGPGGPREERPLDRAANLSELGQPEPALAVLDQWLSAHPDDGEAHARKGILLMNALHRYQEALASLERARQLGQPGLEKRIAFCRHKLA